MDWNFLPGALSLFPLAWAAYLLIGERRTFHSLAPFMVGVILLFMGRLSDVVLGPPLGNLSRLFGVSQQGFGLLVDGLGNLSDAVGALFLVIGFIQTINYQREEETRIRNLEALLPICAWCKNYRTAEGTWKPIEQYLIETGGPGLTHGICPACAAKHMEDGERSRQQ
jgi:hypothetical protein